MTRKIDKETMGDALGAIMEQLDGKTFFEGSCLLTFALCQVLCQIEGKEDRDEIFKKFVVEPMQEYLGTLDDFGESEKEKRMVHFMSSLKH